MRCAWRFVIALVAPALPIMTLMPRTLPIEVEHSSLSSPLDVIKNAGGFCLNTVDDGGDSYSTPTLLLSDNSSKFRLQAYNSGAEELRVFFSLSDGSSTGEQGDTLGIYLDLDHDGVLGEGDYKIRVTRTITPGVETLKYDAAGAPGLPTPLLDGKAKNIDISVCLGSNYQWELVGTEAPWHGEIRIKASDLGLNAFPSVFGLHLTGSDELSGVPLSPSQYPGTSPNSCLTNINQAACWETVRTRYPVDYLIVLDESGSMLSPNVPPQTKWDNAKRAANFFANLMGTLHDPTELDDRLGLVTFSWKCSDANETGNKTATIVPLAVVSFPAVDYVPTSVAPQPDNCTPIGEGLKEAFNASNLDATQPDDVKQRKRGVLLLSDGLQNRPENSISPSYAGYYACDKNLWIACLQSNVAVSTVAFGNGDWDVDTDLLSDISAHYVGDFATGYNLSSDVEDLKQAFIGALVRLYEASSTSYSPPPASFSITSGNSRLIVVASWSDPTHAESIDLVPPAGTVSCPTPNFDNSVGFAMCEVDRPSGGTWQVEAAVSGGYANAPDRLFVIEDLRLRSRFRVDPVQPGMGDALLLTVELRDRGQPVLNDPANRPVRVTVDVERPDESVGTFAVTHEPEACREIRPRLPADPMVIPGATTGISGPPRVAGPQGSSDPDPPLFTLMGQLLKACNQTGLLRGAEEGLELRDYHHNGTYSLLFTNTDKAGTYVFRFHVRGTTADGESFTRTERLAKYVRFEADPEATVSGSRIVRQTGDIVVREYYTLPTSHHDYLGLGYADHVDFVLDRGPGTFVTGVIDYGNGFYARQLEYDRTLGEPHVTAVVQGTRIEGPGPFELGVFGGATFLANALSLDDGLVVGARLGYHVARPVVMEAEGAVTFSKDAAGNARQVIQLLGGVRYDLYALRVGRLLPHVSGGIGYAFFTGFGNNDGAFSYALGAGGTFGLGSKVGLRIDGRVLRVASVSAAGATTNVQATGGLELRF